VHYDKTCLESGSSSWAFTPAVLTKNLNRTLPHVEAGNLSNLLFSWLVALVRQVKPLEKKKKTGSI